MTGSSPTPTGTINTQISEYLKSTPKAVALLFCSYFCGHLWVFILLAYIKKGTKGDTIIKSTAGKTTLGFCWFAFLMCPIYIIKHKTISVEHDKLLDLVYPTILIGIFLQVVIFIIFAFRERPRR